MGGISVKGTAFNSIFWFLLTQGREQICFVLLGDKCAKAKREYRLSLRNYRFILQNVMLSCANAIIMQKQGQVYYDGSPTLSVQSLCEIWVTFCVMQYHHCF